MGRRWLVGFVMALTVAMVVPATASASIQITGGSLTPAFDPETTDYTVRCDTRVVLHVEAPAGTDVSIDGDPFASGSFDAAVPLSEDEGFDWVVREGDQTTSYHGRCLPSDFPPFSVERPGQPQAQWYLVAPTARLGQASTQNYAIIFDNHGVPVWWYKDADFRPFDARLLPNDHLVWAPVLGVYREHAFDSTAVLHTWQTSRSISDFHDLQMLPNGNVLIIGDPQRSGVDVSQFKPGSTSATVIDGEIQEVAPDGHLVWDWNSKNHIALSETSAAWWAEQNEPYDIIHMNSVEDDGDGIIFSARHLDAVYRIDKATGDIDWKLGGSTTSRSLTVSGDPFGSYPFGGQHDARRLSDGTVTVHDNATLQNRSPRAVRYEIDREAMTAKMVESVSDPQVTSSQCCGGARKLPTGNWVMSWGANSVVEELTPASQRVFSLNWANEHFSYRVEPLMPGRLQASKLHAGMDTLHPRPPAAVEVQVDGPVRRGSPFAVTARVLDAGHRVVSGYDGPGRWSDATGTLTPAAPANFVGGVSTTTATIPAALADDRITVTTGGLTGVSAPFAVADPPSAASTGGASGESATSAPAVTGSTAGQPAIPVTGPAIRPLAIDVGRRNRSIRAGRDGRFAFVLGVQDVDATGRIRFTASAPRTALARAGRRVSLASRSFASTAGRATTMHVRLAARQRRILQAARRLRATAAIAVQDGAGMVVRRTYRFTLLAPRR